MVNLVISTIYVVSIHAIFSTLYWWVRQVEVWWPKSYKTTWTGIGGSKTLFLSHQLPPPSPKICLPGTMSFPVHPLQHINWASMVKAHNLPQLSAVAELNLRIKYDTFNSLTAAQLVIYGNCLLVFVTI